MRRTPIFLTLVAALTLSPTVSAQVRTDVATVDVGSFIGRSAEDLVAATLGAPGRPRYTFEMLHDGAHFGFIDMIMMGQMRCPQRDEGRSGGAVLVRDGIVVAQLRSLPQIFLYSGLPETQTTHSMVNGRVVRAARDATPNDPPAQLPLVAGLGAAIAATADINANVRGPFTITCVDYSGRRGSAEGAVQSALIAPFILFQPAENASRENAQIRGSALYDSITLGAAPPADLEARARETRVRLRMHPGDEAYHVLTLDLGGSRTGGIAQPRGVGYIGVRDGIVEWKALSPDGSIYSGVLCVSADGLRGRVRPGCTSTGYYFP